MRLEQPCYHLARHEDDQMLNEIFGSYDEADRAAQHYAVRDRMGYYILHFEGFVHAPAIKERSKWERFAHTARTSGWAWLGFAAIVATPYFLWNHLSFSWNGATSSGIYLTWAGVMYGCIGYAVLRFSHAQRVEEERSFLWK